MNTVDISKLRPGDLFVEDYSLNVFRVIENPEPIDDHFGVLVIDEKTGHYDFFCSAFDPVLYPL